MNYLRFFIELSFLQDRHESYRKLDSRADIGETKWQKTMKSNIRLSCGSFLGFMDARLYAYWSLLVAIKRVQSCHVLAPRDAILFN